MRFFLASSCALTWFFLLNEADAVRRPSLATGVRKALDDYERRLEKKRRLHELAPRHCRKKSENLVNSEGSSRSGSGSGSGSNDSSGSKDSSGSNSSSGSSESNSNSSSKSNSNSSSDSNKSSQGRSNSSGGSTESKSKSNKSSSKSSESSGSSSKSDKSSESSSKSKKSSRSSSKSKTKSGSSSKSKKKSSSSSASSRHRSRHKQYRSSSRRILHLYEFDCDDSDDSSGSSSEKGSSANVPGLSPTRYPSMSFSGTPTRAPYFLVIGSESSKAPSGKMADDSRDKDQPDATSTMEPEDDVVMEESSIIPIATGMDISSVGPELSTTLPSLDPDLLVSGATTDLPMFSSEIPEGDNGSKMKDMLPDFNNDELDMTSTTEDPFFGATGVSSTSQAESSSDTSMNSSDGQSLFPDDDLLGSDEMVNMYPKGDVSSSEEPAGLSSVDPPTANGEFEATMEATENPLPRIFEGLDTVDSSPEENTPENEQPPCNNRRCRKKTQSTGDGSATMTRGGSTDSGNSEENTNEEPVNEAEMNAEKSEEHSSLPGVDFLTLDGKKCRNKRCKELAGISSEEDQLDEADANEQNQGQEDKQVEAGDTEAPDEKSVSEVDDISDNKRLRRENKNRKEENKRFRGNQDVTGENVAKKAGRAGDALPQESHEESREGLIPAETALEEGESQEPIFSAEKKATAEEGGKNPDSTVDDLGKEVDTQGSNIDNEGVVIDATESEEAAAGKGNVNQNQSGNARKNRKNKGNNKGEVDTPGSNIDSELNENGVVVIDATQVEESTAEKEKADENQSGNPRQKRNNNNKGAFASSVEDPNLDEQDLGESDSVVEKQGNDQEKTETEKISSWLTANASMKNVENEQETNSAQNEASQQGEKAAANAAKKNVQDLGGSKNYEGKNRQVNRKKKMQEINSGPVDKSEPSHEQNTEDVEALETDTDIFDSKGDGVKKEKNRRKQRDPELSEVDNPDASAETQGKDSSTMEST